MALCTECGAKLSAADGFCVVCEFVGCDDVPLEGSAPGQFPARTNGFAAVDDQTGTNGTALPVAPAAVPIAPSPRAAADLELVPEPAPAGDPGSRGLTLRVRYDHVTVPADASPTVHALIEVEASGPPLRSTDGAVLAHVILGLDLSASMDAPDKYPVLQRALTHMLDEMRFAKGGDVLVSIVLFAKGSEILLRHRRASELDPREVLGLLDASPLRFTEYTDLAGALSRAGRIALDAHSWDRRVPLRIYMLTDGRPQDLTRAHNTMKKVVRIPVDVHALAFGANADVRSLQRLVAGGRGGTVKHVRSDNLSASLGRIAEVAQHVVAKRCVLDVALAPGVTGGAVHRFRPGRFSFGDGAFGLERTFQTDLGTVEAGRVYSMLVELVLPPSLQTETPLGTVTVRIPAEGGALTVERLLAVGRHSGGAMGEPDPLVAEALDIVGSSDGPDPGASLRALQARHRLYVDERRDPQLISLVAKAITEIEEQGSLESLSREERAALLAHTHSVR